MIKEVEVEQRISGWVLGNNVHYKMHMKCKEAERNMKTSVN